MLRSAVAVAVIGLVVAALWVVRSPSEGAGAVEPEGPVKARNMTGLAVDEGGLETPMDEPLEGRRAESLEPASSDPPGGRRTDLDPSKRVRLLIDENPWLDGSPQRGTVTWTEQESEPTELTFNFDGAGGGVLDLDAASLGAGDFRDVVLAGLVGTVTSLRPLAAGEGADAELRVEWTGGAMLTWSPSMAGNFPPSVEVGIGGRGVPVSRKGYEWASRRGLLQTRKNLGLPMRLPRLAKSESVWIGARGRTWRAFPVHPDSQDVQVFLPEAASLLVLHDPPPTSTTHFIFITAYPRGTTYSLAVQGAGPSMLTELDAGVHEVWIAAEDDRKSPSVSRRVRLELSAGESSEVDLTSAYRSAHLGGVRLRMQVTPDVIRSIPTNHSVSLSRKVIGGARPWTSAGKLPRVRTKDALPGQWIYARSDLEPGRYRIVESCFGTRSDPFDVVVGKIADVSMPLGRVGWVKVLLPEGYVRNASTLRILSATPETGGSVTLSRQRTRVAGLDQPVAAAPGRYRARVFASEKSKLPPLESKPFELVAGETVEVVLAPRPQTKVTVEARHAATGELLAFDIDFWAEVRFLGTLSGESATYTIRFVGTEGAYTGITSNLWRLDEPVRMSFPESPGWEFEVIEPIQLMDDVTCVLRAYPK